MPKPRTISDLRQELDSYEQLLGHLETKVTGAKADVKALRAKVSTAEDEDPLDQDLTAKDHALRSSIDYLVRTLDFDPPTAIWPC